MKEYDSSFVLGTREVTKEETYLAGVTLQLSLEEAQLIRDLAGKCNGCLPAAQGLFSKLANLGFHGSLNLDIRVIDLYGSKTYTASPNIDLSKTEGESL